MALINHYMNRNETIQKQKENMSLYINGEWFGFLTEQFNPMFSVTWQDSGYANIVKGLAGLAKGGVVGGLSLFSKRAGEMANQALNMGQAGLDIAQEGARLNGYVSGQSGLMKKKIFESPNFWQYTAVVEIVDMEGTGLVLDLFQKLQKMALPSVASKELAGSAGDITASAVGALANQFTDFDTDALAGAISRSVVKAPEPVHIKIGNYANTEGATTLLSIPVVIEQFTPVFSKEQTEKGPIKMELTIEFATVEPMVSDAMPIRGGRVTVNNGENQSSENEAQSVLDTIPKPNF